MFGKCILSFWTNVAQLSTSKSTKVSICLMKLESHRTWVQLEIVLRIQLVWKLHKQNKYKLPITSDELC